MSPFSSVSKLFALTICLAILSTLSACNKSTDENKKSEVATEKREPSKILLPVGFRYDGVLVGDFKFIPVTCTQVISETVNQIFNSPGIDKESDNYKLARNEQILFVNFKQKLDTINNNKELTVEQRARQNAVFLAEAFVEYRLINSAVHLKCAQEVEGLLLECRAKLKNEEMLKCIQEGMDPTLNKVVNYRVNQFRKVETE